MAKPKVNLTFGIGGVVVAIFGVIILAVLIGIGLIILLKPLTAIALALIVYAIVATITKSPNSPQSIIPSIMFLLGIAIFFGEQVQQFFESIPVLGIVFRLTEVIL